MDAEEGFSQLVRQAQLGDRQSLDRLAEAVAPRLQAYIYRLTLNHDLTQDLLQETLLKMVERIKELEHPERLWAWLFRTALGQVQHYYRDRARAQAIEISARSRRRMSAYLEENHEDGLSYAMRRELCEATVDAMARLQLTYRNVLSLRCFEQMSYAEIAEALECKELRARVLFFRAKRSLTRQLVRRGFAKGLLVTALGLFGLLTSPGESTSAGAVTASTLSVGAVAKFVGLTGTSSGVAVIVSVAGVSWTLTTEHFVYALLLLGLACFSVVVALLWDT
jgi:RNA polymerase sigma-70 factor (ECF subfamily)